MTHLQEERVLDQSPRRTGFLEALYLDGFDRARLEQPAFPQSSPQAEGIIQGYRNLIADYPPAVLEREGSIPAALMEGLKKLGIFGLNIPREYGGAGLGLADYLSVLQALARTDMALTLTPTAHLSIGIKGIILFGNRDQKTRYLTRAAAGEMIFAYALTEPGTGSDARHIETSAMLSQDGTHYILTGQKTYITNGGFAGGLTVFAQMDPERPGYMGAFIVETAWDGVEVGQEIPKMGLHVSSTTPIAFKEVKVPAENLLGRPGEGFRIAMTILNYGRLGLGAASVGAMEQALEDMYGRSAARKQFGAPIADYELIQEKMVKTAAHTFAASSMTAYTSSLLGKDPTGPFAIESSHVKLYGTTRAWDALYEALQTAGGSGYLATQPYEKRMRDFRVTTVFEGTSEIHSIYPALFLLRSLGRKTRGMSRTGQVLYLLKQAFKNPLAASNYDNPVMDRAAGLTSTMARSVRKMVHLGLLRHGPGIIRNQFLLRRITLLSLATYSLLSSLAVVESAQRSGRDIPDLTRLLEYLTAQTEETYRANRHIGDNAVEKAHRKVFADITSARESGQEGFPGGRRDE